MMRRRPSRIIYPKAGDSNVIHPGLPRGLRPMPPEDLAMLHRQAGLGDLSATPSPLRHLDVPMDMRERKIQEYQTVGPGQLPGQPMNDSDWIRRIALAAEMIASTLVLRRGLFGREVSITTTPQSIVRAEFLRGYIFLNPATSAGLTTTVTVLGSQTVAADGVSASVGVANYLKGHFFINVTAIDAASTLAVFQQAFDPVSGTWFDVQLLASFVGVVGTSYSNVGEEGMATDTRIRWTIAGGAPSATFSVGLVLKDGVGGAASTGFTRTIYIGSGSGLSPVSGFPILEGSSKAFYLSENVELFSVTDSGTLPLKIFEL